MLRPPKTSGSFRNVKSPEKMENMKNKQKTVGNLLLRGAGLVAGLPAVEVGLAGQWPRAATEPVVAGAPGQASEGRSRPVARTAHQQGPSIGLLYAECSMSRYGVSILKLYGRLRPRRILMSSTAVWGLDLGLDLNMGLGRVWRAPPADLRYVRSRDFI